MTLEGELRTRLHDTARQIDVGHDDDAAADAVIARRRVERRTRAAVLGAVAAVLVVALGVTAVEGRWLTEGATAGNPSVTSAGDPSGTPAPGTSGSAPSSSSTAWGTLAACPPDGRAIPSGTSSAPTVDVDGDGRPDTAFISTQPDGQHGFTFGVQTASGALLTASMGLSASPVQRSVLVADVTGQGEVVVLASDGRQLQLWAVGGCRIEPVVNAAGDPYVFDLGFAGAGTGVGCADVDGDGVRELLGLNVLPDENGNPTSIERTPVHLEGTRAVNGAASAEPSPTSEEVARADAVTCGDLTMAANGVTSGS